MRIGAMPRASRVDTSSDPRGGLRARTRLHERRLAGISLAFTCWTALAAGAAQPWPPDKLSETGLYRDAANFAIADGIRPFSPQYPLWSDGAAKLRWVSLPKGGSIDARKPDAWRFPVGTRFWKQFSIGGRRVETSFSRSE